ncbi:hypothetical protein Tco_0859400 [Tanacetum coccineum]|uniref:Uncharacterized protein n=1 Tax=Tanacetum coccineum TaxID=301880 RepID=A0ABQ5BEV6_9ASTR
MIEPEVPLKRKDQIALDEQIARDIQAKLDAKLLEEQKLVRKQEEEANIALIEYKSKDKEGRVERKIAKGSKNRRCLKKKGSEDEQKNPLRKLNVRGRKRVRGSLKKMMKVRLEKTRSSLKDSEEKYGDTRPKLNLKGGLLGSGRNLKILDDEHQFRGGLLGLKRLHGFLEVTAAQVKNRSRIRINTFVSSESTSSTNDVSTSYGVSTSS